MAFCFFDTFQDLGKELVENQSLIILSKAGKDTVEIAPAGLLELGQSSSQTRTSDIPNQRRRHKETRGA